MAKTGTKLTQAKIVAILKKIARQASIDPKYRKRALRTPKKVFQEAAGALKIPASFDVRFYDDTSDGVVTLLPPFLGKASSDFEILCTPGQRPTAPTPGETRGRTGLTCTAGQ